MTEQEENKARGCECLTRIEKQLSERVGIPVELQLKAAMITDPDAESWEMFTELPPLEYKYKIKGKVKKSHVHFAFCPFCGVKKL